MSALLTEPKMNGDHNRFPGDADVLHVLKSIRGLIERAIPQAESDRDDVRVPISARHIEVLRKLAKPDSGLTVRGIVERALDEHLAKLRRDRMKPVLPPRDDAVTEPPVVESRERVLQRLYAESCLCHWCRKVMTRKGRAEDRPRLIDGPGGQTLVCVECASECRVKPR